MRSCWATLHILDNPAWLNCLCSIQCMVDLFQRLFVQPDTDIMDESLTSNQENEFFSNNAVSSLTTLSITSHYKKKTPDMQMAFQGCNNSPVKSFFFIRLVLLILTAQIFQAWLWGSARKYLLVNKLWSEIMGREDITHSSLTDSVNFEQLKKLFNFFCVFDWITDVEIKTTRQCLIKSNQLLRFTFNSKLFYALHLHPQNLPRRK